MALRWDRSLGWGRNLGECKSLGVGGNKSLGGDSLIWAWIWHDTGIRKGASYWEGAGA